MTWQGGANNFGSVYSFDTVGNEYSDVQDFDSANGASPFFNTLMQAKNGKLYGMTVYGGADNNGVVFSFNPADSTYSKLVDFNGANGKNPNGTLLELKAFDGIFNESENNHLTIYPNPVGKELRIRNAELRIKDLTIYNLLGMKIDGFQPETQNSKPETVINISGLSSGIYFVKIVQSDGRPCVGRFVKD